MYLSNLRVKEIQTSVQQEYLQFVGIRIQHIEAMRIWTRFKIKFVQEKNKRSFISDRILIQIYFLGNMHIKILEKLLRLMNILQVFSYFLQLNYSQKVK